jgi:hypothetical protein
MDNPYALYQKPTTRPTLSNPSPEGDYAVYDPSGTVSTLPTTPQGLENPYARYDKPAENPYAQFAKPVEDKTTSAVDENSEGIVEGVVKPTLESAIPVTVHAVASMLQMPISGVAAGAKYISSGGDLNAANKVLEENQKALDDYYLTTPVRQKAAQNIAIIGKPIEMAGQGLEEIVKLTPLEGTLAEPIANTVGQASAIFGMGGAKEAAYKRSGLKNLEGVVPEAKQVVPKQAPVVEPPVSEPVTPQGKPVAEGQATLYSGLDVTKVVPAIKGLWEQPVVQELAEAYKRPPEVTESKLAIGKYTGALQIIDHELSTVAKDINAKIPKQRQEAITRYMQAGGDEAILNERASKSTTSYKMHHEAAKSLTDQEKQYAVEIRQRLDDVWKQANEAGILEDYVENYVRGEWEKPNDIGKKIVNRVSSGGFRTNPKEAMHKVFESYFEGEQLGYKPKDSSIGYQLVSAERSLRNAIEARKVLRSFMESTEKDGRPTVVVGGSGSPLREGATGKEAYFIKPNATGKETGDYKFINHPSMKKWKWVDDAEGKPIFLEGNMWIHPEAYGRINALLGKSKIREYQVPVGVPVIGGTRPGAAMLKAGAFVKGTILLGPFHQFHVGEHAVFHKVKPFNLPEIDFKTRPLLKEGVEHGLQIISHNALQEFGEGLSTGGLFHKIPIAGDYLKQYQEWLFQGYIPKLKAAMFEHAVERAEQYYAKDLASGKLTRDQLLDNAAKQANAAFGEINYKYIGRNPTLQDAFRIIGLAPDFLEARLKFAGQAVRPYGKEQAMALLRGAVIMGATAQILNVMFSDDHKPHWDKPFTVIVGDREYTPRSVVADIMHLAKSPRNFVYQRLNPLWGKPVVEIASGKDRFGRSVDAEDAARDIFKSWIPIPAQGIVKDSKDTFLESIVYTTLQSIGISNYDYRTSFEQAIMETKSKRMVVTPLKGERDRQKLMHTYGEKLRQLRKRGESVEDISQGIKEDVKSGKLYAKDVKRIVEIAKTDRTRESIKSMPLEDVVSIWDKASHEEAKKYLPILMKKASNLKKSEPERYAKIAPYIKKIISDFRGK